MSAEASEAPVDVVVVGAALPASICCIGFARPVSARSCSTRPATSGAPGTGTAIPGARCDVQIASTTATPSIPS